MPETQYFTNIDGKYVKDAEARTQLADLQNYIENLDQPWQPLNDGYSNFWFELTNDTLSPWLRFSQKTSNAVIDWGDGSGEQALDTLTPTHTYSKAGKYVVKVKGVTSIDRQNVTPTGRYQTVLTAVELNTAVTSLRANAFSLCVGLKYVTMSAVTYCEGYIFNNCSSLIYVSIPASLTALSGQMFGNTVSMEEYVLPNTLTSIGPYTFYYCQSLQSISVPANVSSIGNYAFGYSGLLDEIHILSTAPASLGTDPFRNIASDFIIYVPVGTGDTYKAASGWSTYADHILEEGQTPNRAMLAKFGSAGLGEEETDEPQEDMR